MASHRFYPSKICSNPACQALFVPHDKRQLYCSRQCGVNYNNDNKNEAYKLLKHQQKLKHSDRMLAHLFEHGMLPKRIIKESILDFLKVDLNIGTLEIHSRSNQLIRWYIHFGLVRLYGRNGDYVIYSHEEFIEFKKQYPLP